MISELHVKDLFHILQIKTKKLIEGHNWVRTTLILGFTLHFERSIEVNKYEIIDLFNADKDRHIRFHNNTCNSSFFLILNFTSIIIQCYEL